ncbi:MAG: FKBP-type peptidyl-prolyl cis-trans isomerase, partial [Bacteroidales bacterium]|nr:FKBP-type peptidyl-prolyl cis-trans isomerase [Bacteroidales bacterium]
MSIKKSIFLAAILLMVVSCAVEVEENSTTANKRVREAWLRVNYPEAITPNSDGLHILEETKGEGITPGDTSYCFIRYSVRYLDGQYYSTNYPELAKQLGSYSDSIYFGPDVYQLGKYQMYDAMENVVKKMKVGGKIKFLMPPEKSVVSYQTTKKNKLVWT